eukprot:6979999-Ditylum_brightwellii.AAC.1
MITAWEVQAFLFHDTQFLCNIDSDEQYMVVLSDTFKKVKARCSTCNKGVFCMLKTPDTEGKELSNEYNKMDAENTACEYEETEHIGK